MGDSLMLFSVGESVFAIEIGRLLELTRIEVSNVHSEEGPFKYMFDFRGVRTPILDMAELIGMMPTPTASSLQLLVAEMDSHPLAFLIDKVLEVTKGKGTLCRFPEMLRTERNRYIRALYLLNSGVSFVFEPSLALRDHEMAALRAL